MIINTIKFNNDNNYTDNQGIFRRQGALHIALRAALAGVYRCHTKCKGENEHTLAQEAAEQAAEKEAKRLARPSTRRPQKVASKAAEHSAPPPTRRSRKGAPPRAPVGSLHNDSEPRCAQCGLSRTAFPATCVQCVSNKARRAHDKVDGEPAASCLKGRCPPQCVGRNPGVP